MNSARTPGLSACSGRLTASSPSALGPSILGPLPECRRAPRTYKPSLTNNWLSHNKQETNSLDIILFYPKFAIYSGK